MKLPRNLTGCELIKVLCRDFEYREIHQVGSHVLLEIDTPRHHGIPVFEHSPLRLETLNAILRAVAIVKGVDKRDIMKQL
jgi:predicted RNA binding protein YcfA (HicA-like mRNA interferase family)